MDKSTETKHLWDFVKDTSEEVFRKQQEIWMSNSPERRLQMTFEFVDVIREMNKATIRNEHPVWTEKEVEIEQFRRVYKNNFSSEMLESIIQFLKERK